MSDVDEVFRSIATGDVDRITGLLKTSRQLLAARNDSGVSTVLWSLYHGRQDIADLLVDMGSDLDVFDAAALGKVARLQDLLRDDSTCVNSVSSDGFTPLHLASYMGRPEAAKALIEGGADVNALSRNGAELKPLNSAAACRDSEKAFETAKLLLEQKAENSPKQTGGYTPLHSAAANGNLALVKLLLESGADSKSLSDDGRSPLDFARERNREGVVDYLNQLS